MSTGIQWTDETWNPVVGCNQVSPGCDHCYAKALHDKRHKAVLAGKKLAPQYAEPFEVVQLKPERLSDPLSWRKPRRVFVNSVSDLFHKDVPDDFLDKVFAVMALAPRHTFQILTKRAGRMRSYMTELSRNPAERLSAAGFEEWGEEADCTLANVINGWSWWRGQPPRDVPLNGQHRLWPLPNVWLGVSVENNAATSRIGALRQTPAAIRFISFEPLLESVVKDLAGIDWAIIGGESGKGARPFDVLWARDLVRTCRAQGVAPFVKQLGANPVEDERRVLLHDSHGGDPAEWPEDLRVREMPAHSTPQGAVTK